MMRRSGNRVIELGTAVIVILLILATACVAQQGQVVLNFAGNGLAILPVIDGPNLEATIGTPIGNPVLSCDGQSVFVFQSAPTVSIRKIDLTDNTVSLFVGNTSIPEGPSYEDGQGGEASIGVSPINMFAMCWDGATTLLFTDKNTIRAVNETGYVTTLAGSKGVSGSDAGTGSVARFNGPTAISAFSATDNVAYVLDWISSSSLRLCTITPGGSVTNVGLQPSSGTKPISFVMFTKVSEYVSILFTRDNTNNIQKWHTYSGWSQYTTQITAGSANGDLDTARFRTPNYLTKIGSKIYVSDQQNHAIRVIDTGANQVSTLTGLGYFGAAEDSRIDLAKFNFPSGILVHNSSFPILITDKGNNRIRSIPLTPNVTSTSETYAANATMITVHGTGLCYPRYNGTEDCDMDGVEECNIITLISNGVRTVCTTQPILDYAENCVENILVCERDPIPLLSVGQLQATVEVPIACRDRCQNIGNSSTVVIATVQHPPSVIPSYQEILIDTTSVSVTGTNFAPSPELNSVELFQENSTLSCNIQSANTTCIICDGLGGLDEGPLLAVVKSYGGFSGSPVQIAQVVLPDGNSSSSSSSASSNLGSYSSSAISAASSGLGSSILSSSSSMTYSSSVGSSSMIPSESRSLRSTSAATSDSQAGTSSSIFSSALQMSSFSESDTDGGNGIFAFIVVGTGTAIFLLLLLCCAIAVVVVAIVVGSILLKRKGVSPPSPAPVVEIPLPDNAPEVSIEVKALEIPYDQLTIVGRPIGKGSYGEVFRAKYQGSYVAFKRLDANFNKEDVVLEFRREAQVMATLNHHKLLQFIGICSTSNVFGIITELCEKGNLSELIEREKLTWSRKMNILTDIASGMAFIHARGFVHRDLKSPNVLINKHYDAKIADFGLAKVKDQSMKMTGLQGSPYWMAPEVTLGRDYDHKCDVYSYAIICWELLIEKEPYYNIANKPSIVHQVALNPDFRPTIPEEHTDLYNIPDLGSNEREKLHEFLDNYIQLTKLCWTHDPGARPGFPQVQTNLEQLSEQVAALML